MKSVQILMMNKIDVGLGNGYLYNWWAANDIVFPTNWALPTKVQIDALRNFTGGGVDGATNLREVGDEHWANTGGLDLYDFKMFGSGKRRESGSFLTNPILEETGFWSSTENDSTTAWSQLNTIYYEGGFDGENSDKKQGLPARPIYIGGGTPPSVIYDACGKPYNTVNINGQYWTTGNWRCGSGLTKITGDAAWAALTTEGYCSYNNDDQNV